jgi:hypothetical protein
MVEMNTAFWTEYFWDKGTGLLVEHFWSYAELTEGLLTEGSIEYKMVDNNFYAGISDSVAPIVKAGSDKVVDAGDVVVFDAGGSRDDAGFVRFLWDFDDGGSADGLRVTHVFARGSVFNVTLTGVDAGGNEGVDYAVVTVRENPFSSLLFGLSLPVVGLVVFVIFLVLLVIVWAWLRRRRRRRPRRRRG